MRHSKFTMPDVNAGSMADIAFLLLIFFLVTATIPKDQGFNRKLPKPCPPNQVCSEEINERNIFRVVINSNNELMIEGVLRSISDLKDLTKEFVDNNGEGNCNYCNGKGIDSLSDHPKNAVISLQVHPASNYETFIKVQDELTKAYFELRSLYAESFLRKTTSELIKEDIKMIRDAYPFIVSEAETK